MSIQRTQNFSSRRKQNWSRNQNTVAFTSVVKIGPVAHTILLALLVAILGLIYLTQATRATSYDYATQKIDSQISELNNQKSDLRIENARLTSLENVKNSSVASTMTEPESTNFAQ